VFSGKVNPSGKLTMTFPIKYEDTPSAKNWLGTPADNPKEVTYAEGIYVGYRYYDTFNVQPSYAFGYGTSYTTFNYTNVKLNSKTFDKSLTITVNVKNTGKTAGKEVVQLYLSAPARNIDKPKSELKAFAKTKLLAPGESETLTLNLVAKDLASFLENRSAWVAEAGTYTVSIGTSSDDIKKTATFTLAKEQEVEKVKKAFTADKKFSDLKP
jgi:beta-glucosidase